MKVVHLSTVHQTRDNRILNKECRALAEAGIDVTLVVGADEDTTIGQVPIAAIGRRSRAARLIGSQREAWNRLKRLRPDLLQVHDPELVPMALLWGRTHGAKVVYDAHEDLVAQIETKPYLNSLTRPVARAAARSLVGLAARGADGIVAATEPVARGYRRNPKVVVVRNVPWLADFPTPDPSARVLHRAVYTGDLTQERGLNTMIRVAQLVRQQVPDFELVLAGRALRGCQDIVAKLPPDGPVRALGLLPPSEIPAVIASAQVGLIFLKRLPNYADSLPTKVFEYLAAGIPFVATDFPAWERLFGPHEAGVFVDTDDDAATARAVVELINDPARCAQLGANGRVAIEKYFRFEDEAATLVDFTQRLLTD